MEAGAGRLSGGAGPREVSAAWPPETCPSRQCHIILDTFLRGRAAVLFSTKWSHISCLPCVPPMQPSAKRQRKDTGGGGIGLAELLAAGYLKPGRNKVAVAYKGERVTATLTKDGMIIWQGASHTSLNECNLYACSLYPSCGNKVHRI